MHDQAASLPLTNQDFQQHVPEMYSLLAGQMIQYTRGESSSVPIETALRLMDSMAYTIALGGQNLSSGASLLSLLESGRAILKRQVTRARRLAYLVKSSLLPVDFPCYREAVEKGIPSFFATYDPNFFAHETPGDFDYPVSLPCGQTGVSWMLHYLDTLYWENRFCMRFPLKEIEGTLRARGLWAAELPINLFETVFPPALLAYLPPGGRKGSLRVGQEILKPLCSMLASLPDEQIKRQVSFACEAMILDQDIASIPFQSLLRSQAESLAARLVPAVRKGELSILFPPWEAPPPALLPLEGDPLPLDAFRALAGEMAGCRFLSDKLRLLMREVHCLTDFVTLLEAGCFPGPQVRRVFALLPDVELAALMRMGHGCLNVEGRWIFPLAEELSQDASVWEKELYAYLGSLPSVRRHEIIRLAGQLAMP